MSKVSTLFAAAVAASLFAHPAAGNAQPILAGKHTAQADHASVPLVAKTGTRGGTLTAGANRSTAPCGVWVCTWRTSDGGCLVWEKTKCKIINPFD